MTQHEHDQEQERIDALDRQWNRYLDGPINGDNLPDEAAQKIAQLHRRDDAPQPSSDFRQRLEHTLREMHPADATEAPTAPDPIEPGTPPTPLRRPAASSDNRTRPFTRPSTLRQWSELAAMVAILSLAIVGAALYGDEAYDYAQQLAGGGDDVDVSDLQATLEEDGEVDGLTFEEAQALTPFEIAEPANLSDNLSVTNHNVERTHAEIYNWPTMTIWRSVTEVVVNDSDLPPIVLIQQPALENHPIPMPRDDGEVGPTGRLQTVDIGGTGAVQVLERTDGTETTHIVWRQGDVDVRVEIPFDATENEHTVDGLDAMMASIVEQGPLADGAGEIANRGMTLAELRNALPTVPVADPTPEHLELRRVDNYMYGPNFYYEHNGSAEDIDEIWIRGLGSTGMAPISERSADDASDTVHVGDTPVAHKILTDRFSPETSEFIETVGRHADLLLPWISDDSDTALAIYMWSVAGQDYLMGVEIPRDRIDTETHDEPQIATDRPESDWLDIIAGQDAFAAKHLDPAEIFPELAREPTEQDQIPGQEDENFRLIGATGDGLYYLSLRGDDNMLMLHQFVEVEGEDQPRSSGGGNALWHAVEYGIVQQMGGGGAGYHVAWVLPQGYDEVVDEDGNVVGEVENQLFARSFGNGEPRPRPLIARGPAGELYLD